jgi:hypothetical protein
MKTKTVMVLVLATVLGLAMCGVNYPARAQDVPDILRSCRQNSETAFGWAVNYRPRVTKEKLLEIMLGGLPPTLSPDEREWAEEDTRKAIDLMYADPQPSPFEVGKQFFEWCILHHSGTKL